MYELQIQLLKQDIGELIEIEVTASELDNVERELLDSRLSIYEGRAHLHNELVSKKAGKPVFLKNNGNHIYYKEGKLLDGTKLGPHVSPSFSPLLWEIKESQDGFMAKEYSRLTGQPVPNQYYDNLVGENEDGIVCRFSQTGNVSQLMGYGPFQKKGVVITKVLAKTNMVVKVNLNK